MNDTFKGKGLYLCKQLDKEGLKLKQLKKALDKQEELYRKLVNEWNIKY